MKGVAFNMLEEIVSRDHGVDAWDGLLDRAGLHDGSVTDVRDGRETAPCLLPSR